MKKWEATELKYVAPTAIFLFADFGKETVWHGNYGWRPGGR